MESTPAASGVQIPATALLAASTTRSLEGSSDAQRMGFGIFLVVCVILAVIYLAYLFYKRWKSVREFHELNQTNAQAGQVLEVIGRSLSLDEDEDEQENGVGKDVHDGSGKRGGLVSSGGRVADGYDDEII